MNAQTEPTAAIKSHLDSTLHLLAAVILLLFAVSHFLFLTVPDVSHTLQNPVFPMFTNNTMYLIAGSFEGAIGLLCLLLLGRDAANILILTFVGVMMWYHWSFNYVGGTHCSCLGMLGKLLHVSKTQEKVLPIVALIVLFLTTTPWLLRIFRISRRPLSKSLPLVLALILLPQMAQAQKAVEIKGEVNVKAFNPRTGEPYSNMWSRAGFTVNLSGNTWNICATNLVNKRWWEELVWDGTNIYTMEPDGGNYYFNIPPPGTNLVTIRNSKFFETGRDDPLGMYALWITYGLDPQTVTPDKAGLKEIPLPWRYPRDHPDAFGYHWKMSPSPDGRFIADCKMIRERALDMSYKAEALRPAVDFPVGTSERNHFKVGLQIARAIPANFVAGHYHCTEWYRTNDMAIPSASKLTVYYYGLTNYQNPSSLFPHPYKEIAVKVTSVKVLGKTEKVLPPVAATTQVEDYRYRRLNQTRIFLYAKYSLKPGEAWKSANDPALLAQAEYGLKHGVRIDSLEIGNRNIVVWVLLGIGLALAATIIIFTLKKKQNP